MEHLLIPSSLALPAVQFPRDADTVGLATLIAQVVQHAAWSSGPLEIRRNAGPNWSASQRFASLLAQHGLVRSTDTGDCLALSPSPECASLLEVPKESGKGMRHDLVAAVSARDDATCRAVIQSLSDLVAAARAR